MVVNYRCLVAAAGLGANMSEKRKISHYCVYTIRDTQALESVYRNEGGNGTFEESKTWAEGSRLFDDARRNRELMPILFAAAEKEGGLLFYAVLDSVEVKYADLGMPTTVYSFTGLTPLKEERPKSSLIKKSDGKPLSNEYIRPYSVCLTLDFISE